MAGVTRGFKPGVRGGQARTFLLVGTIFAAVSAWLLCRGDGLWRMTRRNRIRRTPSSLTFRADAPTSGCAAMICSALASSSCRASGAFGRLSRHQRPASSTNRAARRVKTTAGSGVTCDSAANAVRRRRTPSRHGQPRRVRPKLCFGRGVELEGLVATRVRIVTTSPSGNGSPSTTIFPATTRPDVMTMH